MRYGTPIHATERLRPLSFADVLWDMLSRDEDARWWILRAIPTRVWFTLIMVAGAVYYSGRHIGPLLEEWGLGATTGQFVAGGLFAISFIPNAVIIGNVMRGAYSRIRPTRALVYVAAAPGTVLTCALLDVGVDLPLIAALAISAAIAVVAIAWVHFALARIPAPVRLSAIWLDDVMHADELVQECERELLKSTLTDAERAGMEANLATGLAVLALRSGGDDALPRAYELLERALGSAESMEVYLSSVRLAEAMAAKERRTGDVEGYEEALQLMRDAAGRLAAMLPSALARAMLIRGTHLAALSRRAEEDGQVGRAARLHEEALDDLLGALERASPWRSVHVLARIKFAALVDRSGVDLDAAIELCRRALRPLRLRTDLDRDRCRLVLCDLLADRAERKPARAARDVAEATRLCRRVQRRPWSHVDAVRRLPRLLRLGEARAVDVADAYRAAFRELSLLSGGAAGDMAAEWSRWTIAAGSVEEAAEAHWCWIRAVADDIRRRPLRAEKERRLARFLDLAGQTADCLIAAGRLRDAAVALDAGRAMLMTERMHRDDDTIGERLVAAGQLDLAARWEQAQGEVSAADHAGFGRQAPVTMLVGGRRFQQRFTTTDHLALTDREALLLEIARVPGLEDVDAPPDYADLQAAASHAPIVYLTASARGTHGVIVTGASEPMIVTLPLIAAELEAHVGTLRVAGDGAAVSDALAAILPVLWRDLMSPVLTRLPPCSLVTLIPLGALSLLPLHAAGMQAGARRVWRTRSAAPALRYAPNARVLARAQAQSHALAGAELPVLTAAVQRAHPLAPLTYADAESDGVVARAASVPTQRPIPASRRAVAGAMDRCAVWHFACHGIHKPQNPLESYLALSDGPLKLREILARQAGRGARLAVLSACETANPGPALLDEVVSFPSALLQAGVAGVVSTQFPVPDEAAMLLVLRFFDELASDGVTPPLALAQAQAWLAGATNATIHEELADVYPRPGDFNEAQLAYWGALRPFREPHCWAPFAYFGA